VIIDAGSSGSRARIYRWLSDSPEEASESGLPNIRHVGDIRSESYVSYYANNRTLLEEHLASLIRGAQKHVPQQLHQQSPIYFMATAGMRLLLEKEGYDMIEAIRDILSNKSISPFRFLSRENARILSGEEEGVFAWIAVNYLSDVFKTKGVKANETYGILELGGASTQIAFLPRGSILADKFPVQIGGVVYPLYVHSYLRYGQKNVDEWVKEFLCPEVTCRTSNKRIENPCMLIGDEDGELSDDKRFTITFIGSGKPQQCTEVLHNLVYKADLPWHCFPKPCAIGSTYQPTIQSYQLFYLIGAFIFAVKSIGARTVNGRVTPQDVTAAAFEFCAKPMDPVDLINLERKKFLSKECLIGLYMPILFTKGYRFRNDSDQIIAQQKIKSIKIEWSLGALIYEMERQGCRYCAPVVLSCSTGDSTRAHNISHTLQLTLVIYYLGSHFYHKLYS